jgi:hypothetical protein
MGLRARLTVCRNLVPTGIQSRTVTRVVIPTTLSRPTLTPLSKPKNLNLLFNVSSAAADATSVQIMEN